MKCPSCGSTQTFVCLSKSDKHELSRSRQYRCNICGVKFSTIEVYDQNAKSANDDYICLMQPC